MREAPKIWFDEYEEITAIARHLPTTLAEYQRRFIGSWTSAPGNPPGCKKPHDKITSAAPYPSPAGLGLARRPNMQELRPIKRAGEVGE